MKNGKSSIVMLIDLFSLVAHLLLGEKMKINYKHIAYDIRSTEDRCSGASVWLKHSQCIKKYGQINWCQRL